MVGPKYVSYVHKNYSLDQRQTFAAKANDQKQDPSPACQLLITSSPRINYYSQPNQNLPHQSRERAQPQSQKLRFSRGHMSTQQLLQNSSYFQHTHIILSYSTHQNHSCKTLVEPAVAASTCATLSLHRSAAAFFASTAS